MEVLRHGSWVHQAGCPTRRGCMEPCAHGFGQPALGTRDLLRVREKDASDHGGKEPAGNGARNNDSPGLRIEGAAVSDTARRRRAVGRPAANRLTSGARPHSFGPGAIVCR